MFFFFSKLVFASFFASTLTTQEFAYGLVTSLPADEVKALSDIGKALGKKWNFSVDPCSGEAGWATVEVKKFWNNVTCSQEVVPHIIGITLKRQNLRGMLPAELVNLPYLQTIDLTRNYLNGTLPREWSSLKLVNIILLGNRISGSIPKEFGNIPTLQNLLLKYNQLSGGIPAELGNLKRLERLHLNSNYLSGELPKTLANLKNMKDFWISDNNFTGNIPDFIQSWTSLEEMYIQASGLNGPIPSSIASLVNLTDLRISDLSGDEQLFPPLDNMTNMKFLILRSCNISDTLPYYLAEMSGTLQVLDLSFNNLRGEIPISYANSKKVKYIYLTGNSLTGSVPGWFSTIAMNIDLSYNNFTIGSSRNCQDGNMNLFGNSNSSVQCSSQSSCQKTWNSLHINCGGEEVNVGENTRYEKDTDASGASRFFQKSNTNWGYSNTGDHNKIWKSESNLSMQNSELYTYARLSPISLSYYAFCMGNRNYKIQLHFAEIMFTDDQTFSSLGRRLFDVYIQGKLVQKDFNIAAEAGGVGKAIIKNFTAAVTNNTLEIRFYWAGKGTDAIPDQGVYGPLISAISVDPAEPLENESTSMSAGTIVGIVAAILASTVLLVLGILWWKGYFGPRKSTTHGDHKGLDLKTGIFTLRQIKAATNNFSDANKIGEGGFGSVYKGVLSNGTVIAVKQLSSGSNQGNREFLNEIAMISALQHPHLVKLYGCCIEENQLLLVYEYLENNNLAQALFGSGSEEHKLKLDWPTRQMICLGIARGLAYLHEESRLKIVHRDIKATNVLLDKYLRPKISDFGLAKLDEEDDTHINTRIAGTFGYMAPEYAMKGYLTDKADVYSFGIVALEIVSGISNRIRREDGEYFNLLDWALVLKERGDLLELVDPRLGSKFKKKEAATMINVALLCANVSSASRPNMSSVVRILEGKTRIDGEMMVILNNSSAKPYHDDGQSEEQILVDAPCSASSSSAKDLYSIHLDSYNYLDH